MLLSASESATQQRPVEASHVLFGGKIIDAEDTNVSRLEAFESFGRDGSHLSWASDHLRAL